jgi:phosphate butyryltransferase
MNTMNVILCGVGGQGVLRAGALLGRAAMQNGYDVTMSALQETEPRGAAVACHVRWGERIDSPVIPTGTANVILSFERQETLRHLPMGGVAMHAIVNDEFLPIAGGAAFPDNVEELVRGAQGVFTLLPARALVQDSALAGAVLLGAFASMVDWPIESWTTAITEWASGDPEPWLAAFHKGVESMHAPSRIESTERPERAPAQRQLGVRTFEEMLALVKTLPPRRVAIAGGQNLAALHAGIECKELGLGTPVYIGPGDVIRKLAKEKFPAFEIDAVEIIEAADDLSIAETAVAVVRNGRADILLKGGVNTPTLMRAALSSKTGLRAGTLLSDTFVFEYPDEDGIRLIMITDGGVTLQPTVQQKVEILRNSVVVAHALGNTEPRVGLLAASETINPNVAATMDAAVITKMNRTGLIGGCIVEGPIALDVAVSRKAAAIKGTASDVAGQADILVAASIDTANALAKSTTYFAGYRLSHVIVGGTAPILIASRSDTADAKLLSIALGSLMAKHFEEQRAAGKK